ncbi:hypothetical protein GDO78_004432 [Eleutherodactylus coqui]|uniref:Uncharacterized protein n=1 Tax=Eleutherodactylus coqui TaxID=57060 RepID=A0A8J6EQV7_ELECQ|nr:hypothetical protein GDO78_004432 [Eleutherodactylus coqui]
MYVIAAVQEPPLTKLSVRRVATTVRPRSHWRQRLWHRYGIKSKSVRAFCIVFCVFNIHVDSDFQTHSKKMYVSFTMPVEVNRCVEKPLGLIPAAGVRSVFFGFFSHTHCFKWLFCCGKTHKNRTSWVSFFFVFFKHLTLFGKKNKLRTIMTAFTPSFVRCKLVLKLQH